jgi:hypothetical protein
MVDLRVVTVTSNLEEYPHLRRDTEEFPYLVSECVEDEVEDFIVDVRDGGYWTCREFFECSSVTHFLVEDSEAPEL